MLAVAPFVGSALVYRLRVNVPENSTSQSSIDQKANSAMYQHKGTSNAAPPQASTAKKEHNGAAAPFAFYVVVRGREAKRRAGLAQGNMEHGIFV